MRCPKHTCLNRTPGHGRPQQHAATGVEIIRRVKHRRKIRHEQPERLLGKHPRQLIFLVGHRRLDSMRDGINTGTRSNVARLGKGQLRIKYGNLRSRLRVTAGHFLMRFSIRN